ncbi:hypothetical protein SASPL_154393 [Salvia splendens]|uniref:Folate-biopterin transporter 4 n=2 Tax=Salvia splendens TaxID=180675 RepID=A0A8X8YYG1_SALSN|nr:hypothetical protein SASPL_154393 [Salvia splendens]
MAMAFGGICGSLFGGYTLDNLQIDKIFLLFSVLPAIQLLSCSLVEESSVEVKLLSENSNSNGASHSINGNDSDEDNARNHRNISTNKSGKNTHRRRRGQKSTKQEPVAVSESSDHRFIMGKWFNSLKSATFSLLGAFRQPIILRPMAWFFLAHVTVPNLSTIMFYYQTEVLKLEASFLGTTRVIGWLGLMLGTFIYNRYLKKMKLRRILLCAHISLSILSLLDAILVSRSNLSLGISDKVMVIFGSALSDGINQFKFMPFLILSGQLCPPGIEGTLFALFMSINNLGSTVSSFVGAGLATVLNISSGSFDNFFVGIMIQVVCTFIPVAFLFLIPKEATGISA